MIRRIYLYVWINYRNPTPIYCNLPQLTIYKPFTRPLKPYWQSKHESPLKKHTPSRYVRDINHVDSGNKNLQSPSTSSHCTTWHRMVFATLKMQNLPQHFKVKRLRSVVTFLNLDPKLFHLNGKRFRLSKKDGTSSVAWVALEVGQVDPIFLEPARTAIGNRILWVDSFRLANTCAAYTYSCDGDNLLCLD